MKRDYVREYIYTNIYTNTEQTELATVYEFSSYSVWYLCVVAVRLRPHQLQSRAKEALPGWKLRLPPGGRFLRVVSEV